MDCGDSEKILKALDGRVLKGIFLTHCHQDHVYGMEKVLGKIPDARVYCSQKTFEGLKDPMLNLSYIMPDYDVIFTHDDNLVILQEGTNMIDDLTVEVLSTSGHSEDCISLIIEDCIFTGDAHIPFAKVFTKWPTSNKVQAFESEQMLLKLISERNLQVCPGHWQ